MFFYPPFSYEIKEEEQLDEYLYSLKEFREFSNEKKKDKHFLNHQKIIARFFGPYTTSSPKFNKLFVIHDMGTGKSGIVCSVFEEYYKFLRHNFNFIYLSNNDVTKNNFLEESKKLSPRFKVLFQNLEKIKLSEYNIFINKYSNTELSKLKEKIKNFETQTIIIVDEVHNIVNRDCFMKEKKEENKIKRLSDFLKLFPNKKIMFMTGTPIRHEVQEILPILSLLLGKKIKSNIFQEKNWKVVFREILQKVNISYFRKKKIKDVNIEFQKGDLTLDYLNEKMFHPVFFQKMSEFQSDQYLNHLFNLNDSKRNSTMDDRFLYRHAIIVDEMECIRKIKQQETISGKLNILKHHSSIFFSVLSGIIQNPHQKTFVYCKYIQFGGINTLVKILEAFGKQHGTDFIRLSCESRCQQCNQDIGLCQCNHKQSSINTKQLVALFNQNKSIKIIIGSDNQSEGISFLDIETIHIVSPWWNFGTIKQAIGRGIRFQSHLRLIHSKKLSILHDTLFQEFKNISKKESFKMFLEEKYTDLYHEEEKIIQLKNENDFLEKLLAHKKYASCIREPEITVKIFLHCAMPNLKNYEDRLNQTPSHINKSFFEILQFKQYQKSSLQENHIKEVLFEIYQNSFDFFLNFYNNKVLQNDAYFKNLQTTKNGLDEKNNIVSHINHDDIYLEENNIIIEPMVYESLKDIFMQTNFTKSFEELKNNIIPIVNCTTKEFAYAILNLLSNNCYFEIQNQKYYLRFQNNFLFLSKEKNFGRQYIEEENKLPPFHIVEKQSSSKIYNLESIKDVMNVKKKLNYLNIDLTDVKQFKKRKLDQTEKNILNTLPKKIRYQLGFEKNSDELSMKIKKNIIESITKDNRFINLQNSLQKNIIAIKIKDKIFIYFIHEVNLTIHDKEVNRLIKKLFKITSISFKNQLDKVLKLQFKNIIFDPKLEWNLKYDIIIKTVIEHEKIKNTLKSHTSNIFQKTWENALKETQSLLERKEFESKKGLKKLFQIDCNNFLKDCKCKYNGKDIQIDNFYQYVIWINLQIINYNLKIYDFQDQEKCRKWELFCKTFLTDKRLDSSGRNLETIYFPLLYNIFINYLSTEEKNSIQQHLESYENFLKNKKFDTERPKDLNIHQWRDLLLNFLVKRKQIWNF